MPLVYVNLLLAKTMGRLLRRNHSLDNAPHEIIFIKILGFGSVLMASDAIFSIKQKYPGSRITIICSRGIAEGIASLNLFDTLYIIEDKRFSSTVFSTLAILFKLWRVRNKWVVDLEVYSKLTSIVSLWTMALNRFGFYHNPVAFRYNLNTHNVYFNTVVNVEENYKRMAMALKADQLHEFIIPGYGSATSDQKDVIAINNTCSDLSPERKLTDLQLTELCNWVLENTPYKLALLGAPSDRTYNDLIIQRTRHRDAIDNLAGTFRFEEYYRFLSASCRLMVTIDSAPLHIANKLGIPNLSVWGPTTPESRIDLHGTNRYIYLEVSCSPCVHFTDKLPCNGNNFCMKDIPLPSITQAIQSMLASISRP